MSSAHEIRNGMRVLADIDRIIHEPARLMILMYLFGLESADYVFLMNATELTWGNLSSHLTKLEEAGYVNIKKGFAGKKPRTVVKLTAKGREAVQAYQKNMQEALKNLST